MTQPANVSSQDPSSQNKDTDNRIQTTDNELSQKDPCNVFIKYLPPELTDSGLYSLFLKFGEIVSCKVMVDPITGHSLGYGFCKFSKPEEAQRAIQEMSGYQISNKTLLCKLSNSMSGNNSTPSDNLYIKPLLQTTTAEELRELFGKFGPIKECKVMIDKTRGCSRQIGFVRFVSIADATKALKAMNGYVLEPGTPPIVVKYAESEEQKKARRMKLLQNQTAAAIRQAAQLFTQLQLQQQQQTIVTTSQYYPTSLASLSPSLSSTYRNASSPQPLIKVTRQEGNATFTVTHTKFVSSPRRRKDFNVAQSSALFSNPIAASASISDSSNANLGLRYSSNYWNNSISPYVNSPALPTFVTPPQQYPPLPLTSSSLLLPYSALPYALPYSSVPATSKTNIDDKSNLFVFHLPHSVDDVALWQMFIPFGPLESVKVIRDKETGKSKGYGFVKFFRVNDAVRAMNAMNGRRIENKRLKVAFKSQSNNKSPRRGSVDTNAKHPLLAKEPLPSSEVSSSSPPLSPSPSTRSSLSPPPLSPFPSLTISNNAEVTYKSYHKKVMKYRPPETVNNYENTNNSSTASKSQLPHTASVHSNSVVSNSSNNNENDRRNDAISERHTNSTTLYKQTQETETDTCNGRVSPSQQTTNETQN